MIFAQRSWSMQEHHRHTRHSNSNEGGRPSQPAGEAGSEQSVKRATLARESVDSTPQLLLDEGLEPLAAARVPELAQRLGLDLADPLAGDREVLADLLERVVRGLADAEAHAQPRGGMLEHHPRTRR